MTQRFAIGSREEAVAYLGHSVLGARLRECADLVNAVDGSTIREILGSPDDFKFRSSMTLFGEVSSDPVFRTAISKIYGGEAGSQWLGRLRPEWPAILRWSAGQARAGRRRSGDAPTAASANVISITACPHHEPPRGVKPTNRCLCSRRRSLRQGSGNRHTRQLRQGSRRRRRARPDAVLSTYLCRALVTASTSLRQTNAERSSRFVEHHQCQP